MNKVTIQISKKLILILALLAILASLAGVGMLATVRVQSLVSGKGDLIADILITEIAHLKAGDRIVDPSIDYTRDATFVSWGVETNSAWLADYMNRIISFLSFDKIAGDGRYPVVLAFYPYPSSAAYTINGTTYTLLLFGLPVQLVMVNERDVTDPSKADARDTLITEVHELIHVQGGNFDFPAIFYITPVTDAEIAEASVNLEAATSAATIEALAGMCNMGDRLACKAFWLDLEQTARNDLRSRLFAMKQDALYQKIAALLWMDKDEEAQMHKYARFWMEYSDERGDILYKYNEKPWRETIIPGIVWDKVLNTGVVTTNEEGKTYVQGMPYDDAAYLVGGFIRYLMAFVQ